MLAQTIDFTAAHFGVKGDNPLQVIKNLAFTISRDTHNPSTILHSQLDGLLKNSMIGIGEGVGVFDWVSKDIDTPYIMCSMLENSVTFPSVDDKSLDIILTLISPEKNGPLHLQSLSRLTRMFRNAQFLTSLRSVHSRDGMLSILCHDNRHLLAA